MVRSTKNVKKKPLKPWKMVKKSKMDEMKKKRLNVWKTEKWLIVEKYWNIVEKSKNVENEKMAKIIKEPKLFKHNIEIWEKMRKIVKKTMNELTIFIYESISKYWQNLHK